MPRKSLYVSEKNLPIFQIAETVASRHSRSLSEVVACLLNDWIWREKEKAYDRKLKLAEQAKQTRRIRARFQDRQTKVAR